MMRTHESSIANSAPGDAQHHGKATGDVLATFVPLEKIEYHGLARLPALRHAEREAITI